MGRVLYNLQNYTGALQYLDKALRIDPSHVYALEWKGVILYEIGHYREALPFFNKALELNPSIYDLNRYNTLDNKGLALMKLQDYTDALSTFNSAISAQNYIDTAHYHKALLLTTLGFHDHNVQDLNIALQEVDKALKFGGGADNVKEQGLKTLLIQLVESDIK